jgi:Nuclease-related domain
VVSLSRLQAEQRSSDAHSVKNRPGEHVRQTIRQTWLDTVKQHVSVWMVLISAVAIYVVLIALLPMSSTARSFWIGFAIATALCGFAGMVYVLSNTYGWSMGKLGEEATVEALSGFWQRRKGWRVINGLLFAGHGNVDHVLVSPGGVFVFESKWTSRPCRIEGGRVVGPTGREPVSQAQDGARKVGRMLRHGPQHFEVSVRPIVVLWGSGAPHLDHGWVVVDGVLVCEGRRKESWLPQLNVCVLDQSTVERVTEVLEDQLLRQVDKPKSSAKAFS